MPIQEGLYFKFSVVLLLVGFVTNLSAQMKPISSQLDIYGAAALRLEYGFIPYLYDENQPAYLVTGTLNCGFTAFGIPLKFELIQTDKRTLNSTGNSFKLSFDVGRYRNISTKQIDLERKKYTENLDSLNSIKSSITKQMDYIELLKLDAPSKEEISTNGVLIQDSIFEIDGYSKVTLPVQRPRNNFNLNKLPVSFIDSLDQNSLIHRYDSLQKRANTVETKISEVKDKISRIEKIRTVSDSLKSAPGNRTFLNNIEKFEIGLTTPSYSTWLINSPIKGVNIQMKANDLFYSSSYGTVIDFNYLNSSLTSNKWKSLEADVDNLFNFQKANNGRKIVSGLVGYGSKESSYLSIGYLYGYGQQNYFNLVPNDINVNNVFDKNHVIEVGGQLKIGINKINASIAKSALLSSFESKKGLDALFERNDSRVYAISHAISFARIKASIKTDVQWIEPLFKSYGLSYMRSDRFNIKAKANKDFKKVKLSGVYKHEEDNILNYFSYKNYSNSYGLNSTWIINRNLSLKGAFSPVIIRTHNEGQISVYRNVNYFAGINVKHKFNKLIVNSDLTYSMNYSFDSSTVYSYQITGWNNTFIINNVMCFTNFNYFKQRAELSNEEYGLVEVGTQFQIIKRLEISASIKSTVMDNKLDPGYNAELSYMISPAFTVSAGAEQLIKGELINEALFTQTPSNKFMFEIKYLFNDKK